MKSNGYICFAGSDWWYHNRNHFDVRMMEVFARDAKVLLINSIVMQRPNIAEGIMFARRIVRKAKSICRGLKRTELGFWVYSPMSLPVHHVRSLRPVNRMLVRRQIRLISRKLGILNPIVWVACPAACEISIEMSRRGLIYQRTDYFEELPNVDTQVIAEYDRKLRASADLTLYVNKELYKEELSGCREAVYLGQGVKYEMFASADRSNGVPADIAEIPKPIIGFFGQIDDYTVDIELLRTVAARLSDMSFVLIGPTQTNISRLTCLPNVHFLGPRPYTEIPKYGASFDVGIMPWLQNKWIKYCSPVKLKEYLALGLPVVTTPISAADEYRELLYIVSGPDEFADAVRNALVFNDAKAIWRRRESVRSESWELKAAKVLELLEKK